MRFELETSSSKARFLTVNEKILKMNLIFRDYLSSALTLQENKSKTNTYIPIHVLQFYETFVCLMKQEFLCHYHRDAPINLTFSHLLSSCSYSFNIIYTLTPMNHSDIYSLRALRVLQIQSLTTFFLSINKN
jgi:hypothetical protein